MPAMLFCIPHIVCADGLWEGLGMRAILLFGIAPCLLMFRVAPPRARHFFLLPRGGRPEKVTKKKGTPTYGPGYAGVPSLHRHSRGTTGCGPPTKGHPWPIAALATSMSLNPLRGDSIRPPEGDFGVVGAVVAQKQSKKQTPLGLRLGKSRKLATRSRQEAEWRCCAGGRAAWMRRDTDGGPA
jgi:hypothetical protein